eukprot:jgi/Chlat1/1374/Chrsp119S01791
MASAATVAVAAVVSLPSPSSCSRVRGRTPRAVAFGGWHRSGPAVVCAAEAAPKFRTATADDMPKLRQLLLEEKMYPFGLQPGRAMIRVDGESGELLAVGQLNREGQAEQLKSSTQQKEFLMIKGIVVPKQHRNQGHGTSMVRHLLEKAARREVFLTTIQSRISFYERLGFTEVPWSEAPLALNVERALGTVLAGLLVGERVLVMATNRSK